MIGINVDAEWAAIVNGAKICIGKDMVKAKAVVALFFDDNVVEVVIAWVFF